MELKDVKNSAIFYERDRSCAAVPGGLVELPTAHYRWLVAEIVTERDKRKALEIGQKEYCDGCPYKNE